MIATRVRQTVNACAAIIGVAVCVMPACAEDASAWSGDSRASVRLIAGALDEAVGVLQAGVELQLAPGWKTYWRYPGDSGVPPRFDFAQSANVKSVTISWPAPHLFADDAGQSIGYKTGVIFPLRIEPQDRTQPVTLRLKLDYAVCEKLCVPAEGSAELTMIGAPSTHAGELAAAAASVPKSAALGEGTALAIRSVRRDTIAGKPGVVVDVVAPDQTAVVLFAEGPQSDWALPVPEPVAGSPTGVRRFSFQLDGLPPGAKPDGATLTLTAVAGKAAIEVKARLD